ncbi:MAG: hypothetical protein M1822_008023 [Bathelium mastoideum]|nr:MAG: hypothetical protein M1822_008023 [Bathelium mastoideum]
MAAKSTKADFSQLDDENSHRYLLDRNYLGACRLNGQSYYWKDALQFNLHPSIRIGENAVVADVAAGTGSWLIDVSREVPSARLDGSDIDLSQAPHAKWLPQNVTMRYWNIFEDLPSDAIAKYDVVHIRLLVLAMQKHDLHPVVQKLYAMLKPGGYLQWDDLNNIDMHVRKVDSALETPALEQLREVCYSNGKHDWILDIPRSMAENGFKDVDMYHFTDRLELARAVNDQHLMTMEEFVGTLSKAGEKDAVNAFRKVISGVYQESLQGAVLCIPKVVCVGLKAASKSG